MKNSLLLFSALLFSALINFAEAQPNLPDSSHVLVVYNSLDQTSIDVKNYYQLRRRIPSTNLVGLNQIQNNVVISYGGEDHLIVLDQQGETIKDVNNENTDRATKHAWIYFNERIAIPIATWLNNTVVNSDTLKNIVRFIILCKGIPFRINSKSDAGGLSLNKNVVLDRLLCLVGETINNPNALLDYFYFNPDNWYDPGYTLENPYYNADPNFTMENNFIPNYYQTTVNIGGQNRTVTLSYLVTHLSAPRYEDITAMIDRSIRATNAQDFDWFIDAHPYPIHGGDYLIKQANGTERVFNLLGISNYYFDRSDSNITQHNKPIMTYSSHGVHQYWPPDYIQSKLRFTYADGSIFNTAESFNGYTIGTWPIIRRPVDLQGVVAEYILVGGTVGVAHSYEPTTFNIVRDSIMFPSYALGYTFIEAAYLGMINFTGDNVVVGDPLTRIAYPCEPTVLTTNTTISSGDYNCGIIVPQNVVLTIASGSTVNFSRNASLKVYGTIEVSSNVTLNFNGYSKLIVDNSGTLNTNLNSHFNFNNHSKFMLNTNLELTNEDNFVFNSESEFLVEGILNMGINSSITFNSNSILRVLNTININPGVVMEFNYKSRMLVSGYFHCIGEPLNKVTLTFSSSGVDQFFMDNGKELNMDYTTINNGNIRYFGDELENLSITNTSFNDAHYYAAIGLVLLNADLPQVPVIANCIFNNCSITAVLLSQVQEIDLEHNSFNINGAAHPNAINIFNSGLVNILDCSFSGGLKGIYFKPSLVVDGIDFNENIIPDLNINQCHFTNNDYGIEIGSAFSTASANINDNDFEGCDIGILGNNFFNYSPEITSNILTGAPSQIGISLSNGNQILVARNNITNYLTGINLNSVTSPFILENNISAELINEPLSGIISISSNGEIRKNIIQHHWYGIELGSSSPNIGANTITDNLRYGIYINDHSYPDLSEKIVSGDPYPLSGYNTIRENGECNFYPSYSELYLRFNSTVNLEKGCNTIADDREDPALHCNYLYLIDGNHVVGKVNAFRNYWGRVNGGNPVGRFGPSLNVNYSGWLTGPCTYSEGGNALLLANSQGEVYDTIYSSGEPPSELTEIESRYATANGYYYNNQYTQAKQEYQGIIEDYGDSTESLQAYNRLYTLSNLMNSSPGTFNQLKDYYLQKAGNQTDSIMIGTLTHLSDLCLVSATEYISAINNFDEEAQQNPNTDIALYRQIDALTTALLLPQDSTMNKGTLGKYCVNSIQDYTNKLSELLRTRGKSGLETGEKILPTEYTLYQNYPNPFNPITTIKYDLPNAGNVSLIIYDILGRKVKELVHSKQEAGRYEIKFDASSLASGVYIYQLITEKCINAKKMILLK